MNGGGEKRWENSRPVDIVDSESLKKPGGFPANYNRPIPLWGLNIKITTIKKSNGKTELGKKMAN